MSTRLGNLKRHFQRKHAGMGSPILQYISGNSIITPEETTHSFQAFRDEYASGRKVYPFHQANRLQSDVDNDEWVDKWIERILKLKEINAKSNFTFQSNNPSAYFTHSGDLQTPLKYDIYEKNLEIHNAPKSYDDVSGFKVDVCLKCLITDIIPIDSKHSIQDIHKCSSTNEEWTKSLTSEEYAVNLIDKLGNLPEILYQRCKEWAENTTGHIYLTCKQIESPDNNQGPEVGVRANSPKLSFLNTLLANSKIEPNDNELREFLKLARSQTRIVIDFDPIISQQKFLVSVSNS